MPGDSWVFRKEVQCLQYIAIEWLQIDVYVLVPTAPYWKMPKRSLCTT